MTHYASVGSGFKNERYASATAAGRGGFELRVVSNLQAQHVSGGPELEQPHDHMGVADLRNKNACLAARPARASLRGR